MALLPKQPLMYKKYAKYRAGTFKVATVTMKRAVAKQSGKAMWNLRSLFWSLEKATRKEMTVPRM
jgi:hypothetical protein